MKKRYFLILLVFEIVFSQAPAIEWQKCLGGIKSEEVKSIQQTIDGGYIVAGSSASIDGDVSGVHVNGTNTDAWVLKINSLGGIEWQNALGGTGVDIANSIQQTTDGGYIFVGSTNSNDGDVSGLHVLSTRNDAWVVKLSNLGAIEWQKALGGTGIDDGYDIQQTTDGGYIMTGTESSTDGDLAGVQQPQASNGWILKLSSIGEIQWQKGIGGSSLDGANSIQQTTDGGYIMAGYTTSNNDGDVSGFHGGYDCWIVKLSMTGLIEWQKCLGAGLQSLDRAFSIQQTMDGGYIMGGQNNLNGGDVSGNHGFSDGWIVKLSSIGIIEWQKSLGGSIQDGAYSLQQTNDGGYIIGGVAGSSDFDISGYHGGSSDSWVVKLSSLGIIEWNKCLGGTDIDWGNSIQQTVDGGYIVAGYTVSNNGDVIGNHGSIDAWVVKLGPDVLETDTFTTNQIKLFPNPTTTILTVKSSTSVVFDKMIVTDLTVKTILVQTQNTNQINVEKLASGIYILQAYFGEEIFTGKFVKK